MTESWPKGLTIAVSLGAGLLLGGLFFSGGETETAAPEGGAAVASDWTCSMHPQIHQPHAGTCPICGMDLIPAQSGAGGGDADEVVLSERAKQLARLRVEPARRRGTGASRVRLLGRIEPDERALKTLTAWTAGRIERLHVNVTGQKVKRGQVMATLYSPEIYSAHQDLLTARTQKQQLEGQPGHGAATAALNAARERLRLLGVPKTELRRLEKRNKPTRSVPVRAPFGGTVMERLASEGNYVTTGAPLYRVADLDKLWVQLEAYESDLARLAVGQRAEVQIEALPGETFDGTVAFIEPTLDSVRRVARARIELSNPDGRLKPGLFASATVFAEPEDGAGSPLLVPATAPLFTGRRALVYVEDAAGAYHPRPVRLGPRLGDYYPVVAGLNEGERVVTRGAFSLDADLQIRGGASMMSAPDDSEHSPLDDIVQLAPEERAQLAPTVQAYLDIQKALAADDLEATQGSGHKLIRALEGVSFKGARPAQAWARLHAAMGPPAQRISRSAGLEPARGDFEHLTHAVLDLLRRMGNPLEGKLAVANCPMAFGNRGATWVQPSGPIDNSYFGASMKACGSVTTEVDGGGRLPIASSQPSSQPSGAPSSQPSGQ